MVFFEQKEDKDSKDKDNKYEDKEEKDRDDKVNNKDNFDKDNKDNRCQLPGFSQTYHSCLNLPFDWM